MSQVRPRLLDDIAMLPNGGHRRDVQRAADARLVAGAFSVMMPSGAV